MSENQNETNSKKQSNSKGSIKPAILLLLALASSHFAYDVWDREFRSPPPPITQQVKNLVETNKATWEALKEINKTIPPQFKK